VRFGDQAKNRSFILNGPQHIFFEIRKRKYWQEFEDHKLLVSLRSDCCKLIKSRWQEFWESIQWGTGTIIFRKIGILPKTNPRNNEMITYTKFQRNRIVGNRLKDVINNFGGLIHGGGGSEFFDMVKIPKKILHE